jgi:hypothetical protein
MEDITSDLAVLPVLGGADLQVVLEVSMAIFLVFG